MAASDGSSERCGYRICADPSQADVSDARSNTDDWPGHPSPIRARRRLTLECWWDDIESATLAQGDYLPDCVVPAMPADFVPPADEAIDTQIFQGTVYDLIIVTQSCDLENGKAPFVATVPISPLTVFERHNPRLKDQWENVRRGRQEGLHLLSSLHAPHDNHDAMVVDFRQIYSLPVGYLINHAKTLGSRKRLRSPYLEHFSQAFARFFMRVGLPSSIPPFK